MSQPTLKIEQPSVMSAIKKGVDKYNVKYHHVSPIYSFNDDAMTALFDLHSSLNELFQMQGMDTWTSKLMAMLRDAIHFDIDHSENEPDGESASNKIFEIELILVSLSRSYKAMREFSQATGAFLP